MSNNFEWKINSPLPHIEQHSKQKLEVLKKYLDSYFDTVVPNPATDKLNITLVDGFSGGGTYQSGGEIEIGSPLLLIQAVDEAEKRLNIDRSKPLKINAKFYFIDNVPAHIDHLKMVLKDSIYWEKYKSCVNVISGDFHTHLPQILTDIQSSQRVGRSIFVLDQCGYKDVPMASINSIFSKLERAEVILTFAIDSVLNYLQENSIDDPLYQQFDIDQDFLAEWNKNKEDKALGRLISQRVLMRNIQNRSGAKFFTPFMLWSRTDNRWMMIAHLSQHQAARDKMLGVHWSLQNRFAHIGKGSLFSLGYDVRLLESKDSLFEFSELDRNVLKEELLNELPRELRSAMIEEQIKISTFMEIIGNRTAATNRDIFSVLGTLISERDIQVVNENGRQKRVSSSIHISDRIILPAQRNLFG